MGAHATSTGSLTHRGQRTKFWRILECAERPARTSFHPLAAWLSTLLIATFLLPALSVASPPPNWVATWGSSQSRAVGAEDLPKQPFDGATLRQVVRISVGGTKLRLHLSNAFGDRALVVRSVYAGPAGSTGAGAVDPHSQFPVFFNGNAGATIPAGAEYVSDPVSITVAPLSDVTITMLIDSAPKSITTHSGARATTYLISGDHVIEDRFLSPETLPHWYFLAGVEVQGAPKVTSVVTLGDSITDGHGVALDTNQRWPDVLARRLSKARIAVVNQGIGGNRVLEDGLGPNALARFDRDVLGTTGARYLIVLEGVNDLGGLDRTAVHPPEAHDALVKALETAFVQIVDRAHSHGLVVFGGTVTPYRDSDYYHPSEQSEADRNALNQWIRTAGVFDAVIDFDKAMRDPAHPDRMDREVDSGDHLHPNPAGYERMGETIPLELFSYGSK
jgi:lysophospholipase L1-like esterase